GAHFRATSFPSVIWRCVAYERATKHYQRLFCLIESLLGGRSGVRASVRTASEASAAAASWSNGCRAGATIVLIFTIGCRMYVFALVAYDRSHCLHCEILIDHPI